MKVRICRWWHVGFGQPGWMLVEVLAECVVAGEGAVEFAFEGVSSDVGSGELRVLDAVGTDVVANFRSCVS